MRHRMSGQPRTVVILASLVGLIAGTAALPPPEAGPAGPAGEITGTVSSTPAKYRKDVVVYVEKAAGPFAPPTVSAVMDQKGLVFIPHVLPVLEGTTVDFLNSDNVRHNVFTPDGEKYNLGTWPQGEKRSHTFPRCASPPCVFVQLCNVHPEMEAFVVVLGNPYFAVTDGEGRFTISGVPPGEYLLKTWSEKKLKSEPVTISVAPGAAANAAIALTR